MNKPYISGFTIVRNAIKYDYPIVESIKSILPVVDEYVIAVGNSEDDTLGLINSIGSPKIKVIRTVWDDSLREGGRVLAEETNKAFDAIGAQADWCFYLQGDEVVHEKYHDEILKACATYKYNKNVDGLLFKYEHFYGSYDYVGDSRTWYRKEIRIIKNDKAIRSYRDAQGFRKNGEKLNVKPINAEIYHYGWVKDPRFQQAKQENFHKLWHDDNWVKEHVAEANQYDYSIIDSLQRFTGAHPAVMKQRLERMNWDFNWDTSKKKFRLKEGLLYWFEKLTGKRLFEYRNYRQV
ncbi:MAG: glycosyltransferase family 2 protein [Bacteroidota bacterium]